MIIAAIDFSDISESVILVAAELAAALATELLLLHAAAPDPDFVGYDVGPQSVRDDRARTLKQEHKRLQARADTLRQGGLEARALLVEGPTVETVLDEARKHGARMIVVGSHGRGTIGRALLGSVSEGLARAAHCPVLIVPPEIPGD
jgi:nucleotide-binding universal stress UspA family protein